MSNNTFITIEAHELSNITGGITRDEAVGHGEKVGGIIGGALGSIGGAYGGVAGGGAGAYLGGWFAGDMYDGKAMIPTGTPGGFYDQSSH